MGPGRQNQSVRGSPAGHGITDAPCPRPTASRSEIQPSYGTVGHQPGQTPFKRYMWRPKSFLEPCLGDYCRRMMKYGLMGIRMHSLDIDHRRVSGLIIGALILPLTVLIGCADQSKAHGCLGDIPVEGDLTLSVAQSLVGKTVPTCAGSSNDPTTPGQLLIEKPWDSLLSVDGMDLPADVLLPGSENATFPLADCNLESSITTHIQAEGKWFKTRSVRCSVLD
jgi:hypothetical protein